jgi:hypothetical protein
LINEGKNMADTQEQKMKKFEDIRALVMKVVDLLDDPKKDNHARYTAMFDMFAAQARAGKWSDFDKFCNWCNDPNNLDQLDHSIYIQSEPFHEPKLTDILKALDTLGVPSQEYVYFRDFGGETPVRSTYRIPVGYINVKRMQQILSKKNHYSLDNTQRNLLTDQVTGESKTSAFSDAEAAAMVAQGYDDILKELWGARSGDEAARIDLAKQISTNGFATIQNIQKKSKTTDKTTLNTLNTYLLASGYRTDLIMNSLETPYTLDQKNKRKIKRRLRVF